MMAKSVKTFWIKVGSSGLIFRLSPIRRNSVLENIEKLFCSVIPKSKLAIIKSLSLSSRSNIFCHSFYIFQTYVRGEGLFSFCSLCCRSGLLSVKTLCSRCQSHLPFFKELEPMCIIQMTSPSTALPLHKEEQNQQRGQLAFLHYENCIALCLAHYPGRRLV